MTIEEKAKAYDKALEKAKDFYKGYKQRDNQLYADDLETIFPELCESEDERVRKEIISFIQDHIDEINLQVSGDYDTRDKEDIALQEWCKKAIAWLEKQKEYESTDFEYVWDRTDCGDLTSALDKYSEEAIINMCHAWYDKGIELERKSWLEKRCYTKKDVDDAYLKGICYTKHELEKQGERSIYNVPSREVILAIWDLGNEWKELTNGCISAEHGTQLNYIQKHWQESTYYLTVKQGEQKPQRMISAEAKEALYDKPTDEEMKELLRTEYEKGRADTIAEMEKDWSEEDEVKINRIVACLENLNVADNDILLKDVDWLKSLKDRVILQPKHEWSIEDERVIAIINNALTESNTPPDDYDKVYDWLESLRQRI